MLVSELIEKLKQVDQNIIVLARGYEDGYDAIDTLETVYVQEDNVGNDVWYEGAYHEYKNEKYDKIKSIILF